MFSTSVWFNTHLLFIPLPAMILTLSTTLMLWWRDVTREASYMGLHPSKVQQGMRYGMIFFIISEIFFFSAFFWALFHSCIGPTPDVGCLWPPKGVHNMNPFSIPLLNTAILLSSGGAVTNAHHNLMLNNNWQTTFWLLIGIMMGLYFTLLQAMEYLDSEYAFYDTSFGSTFFIATGFHGAHVIVGSLMLMAALFRSTQKQLSSSFHFGFEAAAWYWHFVDVIWLLLFMCAYYWAVK